MLTDALDLRKDFLFFGLDLGLSMCWKMNGHHMGHWTRDEVASSLEDSSTEGDELGWFDRLVGILVDSNRQVSSTSKLSSDPNQSSVGWMEEFALRLTETESTDIKRQWIDERSRIINWDVDSGCWPIRVARIHISSGYWLVCWSDSLSWNIRRRWHHLPQLLLE